MRKVLDKEFFDRPTRVVAKELLGKYLVRRIKGKEVALMIVETEAYDGVKDLASHSSRGRTSRTEVMFGPAGVWYVYFVYGMHEMLNIVTKKDGAAALIRGGVQTFSHSQECENVVFDGPAKLTKFLKIDRSLNMKKADKKSGLWVEDRGAVVRVKDIKKTARIGIAYAGPYVHKLWRFILTPPTEARAESRLKYPRAGSARGDR